MLIEIGKVREYARATGATAPDYFAAHRAPIPPTFLASVVFWEDLTTVFETMEARAAFAAAGLTPDVSRLLSLAQEYEFPGPYPRTGDELMTTVRFERVESKEARSGTMVLVHFVVEFTDREGALVALARYTSAYLAAAPRASRAVGTARAAGVRPPGEALPERRFGPLSMTDIVRYQGASGDFNPMHHDDELARAAGYPASFSVGMLGAAYLATYCVDQFGVESLARVRFRFRGLVYRGQTLTARGWAMTEESSTRVELQLVSDAGDLVVEAEADLR